MKGHYDEIARKASRCITRRYSTSFSLGIRFLHLDMRQPIHNIYGFVRLADEIVDSFHGYDQRTLLEEFRRETYSALDRKISTNPVLHAFQETVNAFGIDRKHIDHFLDSMAMDLDRREYNRSQFEQYILGSAEVVGCMCLRIFVAGDEERYGKLEPFAMRLGSAFQKVNFLRDLKADYGELGRVYFPGFDINGFGERMKQQMLEEIEQDFQEGFRGILLLPPCARFGVYLAYIYYIQLLNKLRKAAPEDILQSRIRVSNKRKAWLLFTSYFRYSMKMNLT